MISQNNAKRKNVGGTSSGSEAKKSKKEDSSDEDEDDEEEEEVLARAWEALNNFRAFLEEEEEVKMPAADIWDLRSSSEESEGEEEVKPAPMTSADSEDSDEEMAVKNNEKAAGSNKDPKLGDRGKGSTFYILRMFTKHDRNFCQDCVLAKKVCPPAKSPQ